MNPDFRQPLRDKLITFICNHLCYIQLTQTDRRMISLIIFSTLMRCKLFEAYHATPVAGHMGVYKMLHRLCLCFFWPKMQ